MNFQDPLFAFDLVGYGEDVTAADACFLQRILHAGQRDHRLFIRKYGEIGIAVLRDDMPARSVSHDPVLAVIKHGLLRKHQSETEIDPGMIHAAAHPAGQPDSVISHADGMAQSSAIDIGKTGDIDKMEDLTSLLDSMKAAIDLGTFQPGDKGTLSFELVISPDAKGIIDNSSGIAKYSGFVGAVAMVDWVFVAANTEFVLPDEPPKPTPPVPRTGEETLPYTAAAVACGLGALGIYATAFRKRKKDMAE